MNRAQRKARRRRMALEWQATHYRAVKAAALLSGVNLPWDQFERLHVIEQYKRKKLLNLWIEWQMTGPSLLPTNWLNRSHTSQLQTNIAAYKAVKEAQQ